MINWVNITDERIDEKRMVIEELRRGLTSRNRNIEIVPLKLSGICKNYICTFHHVRIIISTTFQFKIIDLWDKRSV